jgi:hypothetical protein
MPRKAQGQRAGVKQFARGIKRKGTASPPAPLIIPRLQAELDTVRAASAAASDKVRRQLAAKRARDQRVTEEGP